MTLFFRLKKCLLLSFFFVNVDFQRRIDQLSKEIIINQMKSTGIALSFSIKAIVNFAWLLSKKGMERK